MKSKNNSLLSIILTLYNKAPYIEEAIFSIYKQTYTNRELIIVDDCSTDGSFEIAKSFCEKLGITSKCKFIKNEKNLWVAKTFERGLKEAKGDWISMCDGDDILMKNKLEENLSFCTKNNIDFCHSDLTTINENNNIINISRIKEAHIDVNEKKYNKLICGGNVTGSSVFFSQKIGNELKNVGFPDSIRQDWRALIYSSVKNYKIGFIKKSLVYYRKCESSITKDFYKDKKSNQETIELRKKIFSNEISCCDYIINKKIYTNNEQKKWCSNHISINNQFLKFINSKDIFISFKLLKNIFLEKEPKLYYRILIIQIRKFLSYFIKS